MPIQQYLFGLQSFHVDNCRSKGDHNDSDTLGVVVTSNRVAFPPQQVLLGDNLHAGDKVIEQFVGPFDFDDASFVTVTYSILNGVSGSNADAVLLKIAGVVLATFAGLEEVEFLGLVASNVETAILSAVGGVIGGIGEFLGIKPSDPDCHGPVATRTMLFSSGQLNGTSQSVGPVTETERSPSVCGNDPHSTVIYLAQPVQRGWHSCRKCQGMHFAGFPNFKGVCPAGDQHDGTGSFEYFTMFGTPGREQVQADWRSCRKCQGLFFGPGSNGICPADHQAHDPSGSFEYVARFSGS